MRRPGWARGAALLLLVLFCCGISASYSARLPKSGGVTLYLPRGGYSSKELNRNEQRAAEPVAFTPWSQQEGQTLTSAELERTSTVGVVTVYGDSTLVLPQLPMLLPGNTGCLLDTDSCYALFGDFSPIGAVVELDGAKYTVTGVFDYPAGMLVRQGTDDSNWNRVTLSLDGAPDPDGMAREFALRHGLSPYGVLSMDIWCGLAGVFSHLLPLLVLVSVLYRGLGQAFRRRATPVQAALALLLTFGVTATLWVLCGLSFTVPLWLIPARWSDFEFWTAAFTHFKSQLWLLLTIPRELPHGLSMVSAIPAMLWGVCGALLYPWCLKTLGGALRRRGLVCKKDLTTE